MKFNEKLKALRALREMTQDDVAEKMHVTRQSVSKWEQGINEPNLDTIKKLCHIFDVSIDELIDDNQEVARTKREKLKEQTKKLWYWHLGLSAFSVLLLIGSLTFIKDSIAAHYDIDFNPIHYGSKYELLGLLILPIILISVQGIIYKRNFGKNYNQDKSIRLIFVIMLPLYVIMIISMIVMTIFNAKDMVKDSINYVVMIFLTFMIIISIFSSNLFNKKPNYIFGFRTNFTINNHNAWKKVNNFQSISAFIAGLVGYLIICILNPKWSAYLVGLIILSVIPTLIYHEVLRKTENKK